LEDKIDLEEARAALAESKKKGTVSWDKVKKELGFSWHTESSLRPKRSAISRRSTGRYGNVQLNGWAIRWKLNHRKQIALDVRRANVLPPIYARLSSKQ